MWILYLFCSLILSSSSPSWPESCSSNILRIRPFVFPMPPNVFARRHFDTHDDGFAFGNAPRATEMCILREFCLESTKRGHLPPKCPKAMLINMIPKRGFGRRGEADATSCSGVAQFTMIGMALRLYGFGRGAVLVFPPLFWESHPSFITSSRCQFRFRSQCRLRLRIECAGAAAGSSRETRARRVGGGMGGARAHCFVRLLCDRPG